MRSEIHPQEQMIQFLHAEADEAYEAKDWRRTARYSKKILEIDSTDSQAESLRSQAHQKINQKVRYRILKWMFAVAILGGLVLQAILFGPILAPILGQGLVSSSLYTDLGTAAFYWVLGSILVVIYFYFKARTAFDEYADAPTAEEFKRRKGTLEFFILCAVLATYLGVGIIFGLLGAYHHGFIYWPNYFPLPNHNHAPQFGSGGGSMDGLQGISGGIFVASIIGVCLISVFMRIVRAVLIRQIR